MKNNKLYIIAALLGVALAGCQKEELYVNDENPDGKTWKLTVLATKDVDFKALDIVEGSGGKPQLNASWNIGEKVNVFLAGDVIGTLTVISVDGEDAVLSGKVDVDDLQENDQLLLLFPGRDDEEWNYLDQDGTIGTIAGQYDYATAELTVSSLDSENQVVQTTMSTTIFTNQQSVYRLGFKVGSSAVDVESIVLTSAQNKLVRDRTFSGGSWTSSYGAISMDPDPESAPDDHIYFMSIRNDNEGTTNDYTFSAVRTSDNAYYEGTKVINKTLVNGKFYNASVNMNKKSFATASGSISTAEGVL